MTVDAVTGDAAGRDATPAGRAAARGAMSVWADRLFLAACLLIPFENLFFAPSHGWAAIAPLVFPAYCLWCWRELSRSLWRLRRVFAFVAALCGLSALNWLVYPPNWGVAVDVGRALALGLVFLVALDVHFRGRGRDPDAVIGALAAGYGACILVGFVQLAAVWWELFPVKAGLAESMKRSSLHAGRIHFTFTEPSFISMHVYGVIVPLCVFWRHRPHIWQLRAVGAGIVVLAIVARPSLRFLVDTIVVFGLWLFLYLAPRGRRQLTVAVVGAGLAAAFAVAVWATNERVQRIVERGVYGEASLSARYFRWHASVEGYRKEPLTLLTGHGFSNVWVPFQRGYPVARAAYEGKAHDEVDALGTKIPASLHAMPVRLVSEFGLIGALLVVVLLFSRRHLFPYAVLLYCYVQFDSYAFYALWIYVFFARLFPRAAFPAEGGGASGPGS